MPIRSEWGNSEHTIIVTTYSDEWTWHEAYEHTKHNVVTMLNSVSHAVTIVENMREAYWLSPNDFLPTVKKQLQALESYDIRLWLFVIKESYAAALLINAYEQFDGRGRVYRAVDDLHEALHQAGG